MLVEGTALYFGGADARQAVTTDLDLRGAKLVTLLFVFPGFGHTICVYRPFLSVQAFKIPFQCVYVSRLEDTTQM